MLKRQRLGVAGEAHAAAFLEQRGYAVLDRRFACRRGDIDIVCGKGEARYLVEVKTRAGVDFGSGADLITESKRLALAACAREYRALTGWRGPLLFLFVAVRLGYGPEAARVELHTDAIR